MDLIHELDQHASGFGSALSNFPKNLALHYDRPFAFPSPFDFDKNNRYGVNSPFDNNNMFTTWEADNDEDIKSEQTSGTEQTEWCETTAIASAMHMGSGGWQKLAGEVMRNPARVLAAPPPTRTTHLHYQSTNTMGRFTSNSETQEVFFCMERGCSVEFIGDDAEKALFDHGRDVHYRFASLRYRVGQSTLRVSEGEGSLSE
jgi:hypothetical protein